VGKKKFPENEAPKTSKRLHFYLNTLRRLKKVCRQSKFKWVRKGTDANGRNH